MSPVPRKHRPGVPAPHPPCSDRDELSAEVREVLHCALSYYLASGEDRVADYLYRLSLSLDPWARTTVPRGSEILPAPDPPAPKPPYRGGLTALRMLGLEREELTELWEECENREGVQARLPLEIIDAFFQPRLWITLAKVLEDGPALACRRLDRAVRPLGKQPSSYPGVAPDSTISEATLKTRLRGLRGFMGALCHLREQGHPSPLLEPWIALPRPAKVKARRANTDRSAPPLRTLRLVWQQLNGQAQRKFGPLDTQALNIRSRASYLRDYGGMFILRNRVLLMLFFLLGGRRDALSRLKVGDYDPRHRTPNGEIRPAICIRPGKTVPMSQPRWKVLPAAAGLIIEIYLVWLETVEGRALRPEDPLIVRATRPLRALSYAGVYNVFRGEPNNPAEVGLVPKDLRALSSPAELSPEERRCYSPHTLRHAASQLAEISAQLYCSEVPTPVRPGALVKTLLDHEVPEDPYGYLDVSTERGRERYAAICIEGIWRHLTTAEGARKSIDVPALRRSLRLRRAVEANLARVEGDLRARHRELDAAALKPQELSPTSLPKMFARQAELFVLIEDDRRLREELASINAEIAALKDDPRRRVPLPDSESDSEIVTDATAIEAEEDGVVYIRGKRTKQVRDWITIKEFRELARKSVAQVSRWVAGKHLPHSDGDPRNPWPAEAVPLVTIGPRRRVLLVAGISPTYIASEGCAERLATLLSEWPDRWSARAIAQMPVPDPAPQPEANEQLASPGEMAAQTGD